MSSAGRAVNLSGFATTLKERELGLSGFAAQIRLSSSTGSYVMETAEHREPCESRGSRTDLGAPGGEIPPGDSTIASFGGNAAFRSLSKDCVAKLSLRLRLNRDSVDQGCDSRGAVDDGAARARTRSILLRVRSRQGGAGRSFGYADRRGSRS